MPLTRAQLEHVAIERYFKGFNDHDVERVMGTFADNCVMKFSSANREFEGLTSLREHTVDFMNNFKTINFHDFHPVIDARPQKIAVWFYVQLIDHDGEEVVMNNCNFFEINRQGLFTDIHIFNAGKLDKGFRAGNTTDDTWDDA